MKRLITEKQEQALRLCHHDFENLTQVEAAKRIGISQSALSELLAKVKKVLPQYFPILTKLEYKCYNYYMNEGWSVDEIAEHLGETKTTIYKALGRAYEKGMWRPKAHGRIQSYDELQERYITIEDGETTDDNWLDFHVKQKF